MRESSTEDLMGLDERLVGFEFENPILDERARAISANRMQKVWRDFEGLGWRLTTDKVVKTISGAEKDFGSGVAVLSSDAGAGNLEMALPPVGTIQKAEKLLSAVRGEILQILKKHCLSLVAFGLQPAGMRQMDKLRAPVDLHEAHVAMGLSDLFSNGLIAPLSAVHVGISIKLDEVTEVVNELTKITGLVVSLCGNSPIQNWKILPWKDWRILAFDFRYLSIESSVKKLEGFPERPFTSLSHFFSYYWRLPYMALPPRREDYWVIPKEKMSYIKYFGQKNVEGRNLFGKNVSLTPSPRDINLAMIMMWLFAKPHIVADPEKITVGEFMEHLEKNSLESYLKGKIVNCYIEFRAASTSPVGEETALPALILGLVNNMVELKRFTKQFSWKDWKKLVYVAATDGMDAGFKGKNFYDLNQKLVGIAERGLAKRKLSEVHYLKPLWARIDKKQNPADEAVAVFRKGKKAFLEYVTY